MKPKKKKSKSSITKEPFLDGETANIEIGKTVKNLQDKKLKPSIFIGSSTEAHHIAGQIKKMFDKKTDSSDKPLYEVDTWKMNVFGGKIDDKNLSIAEQLKNFTDIYDFAIFLFVPDERIIAPTRTIKGKKRDLRSYGVKHNVIFEFGLFLGRLGARRSIILHDDSQEVQDFIDLCFTDLKDEFANKDKSISSNFKVEFVPFKGKYTDYINDGNKELSYDAGDLEAKVNIIEQKVIEATNTAPVSFLPSTSLAVGYNKNFLERISKEIESLMINKVAPLKQTVNDEGKKESRINLAEVILQKEAVKLYILIPNSLMELEYRAFADTLANTNIVNAVIFPSKGRDIGLYVNEDDLEVSAKTLHIYDFPTTLNSSIEAIEFINKHKDIRELLAEKEKRNFKFLMNNYIGQYQSKISDKKLSFSIELLELDEFNTNHKRGNALK